MCIRDSKKGVKLHLLPNHDWRERGRLKIYIPVGVAVNWEELKPKIATNLRMVLLSRKVPMWARHRWKGAAVANGQVTLLEALGGLLSEVLERFAKERGLKNVSLPEVGSPGGGAAAVDEMPIVAGGDGLASFVALLDAGMRPHDASATASVTQECGAD